MSRDTGQPLYYCSNEQHQTVDVFDTRTLQPIQQIPLSERPNKIVVSRAGPGGHRGAFMAWDPINGKKGGSRSR